MVKIRTGDTVVVIAGKDKGKQGKVLKVFTEQDKVVVEGVNIVSKHVKPSKENEQGGIVKVERPIHVSNVMFFDKKTKKAVRIGFVKDGNKKFRISRSTGEKLDA